MIIVSKIPPKVKVTYTGVRKIKKRGVTYIYMKGVLKPP